MKPPPPMLPARGKVTASAKPTATAASTALPPCFKISTPARVANVSWLDTMPCLAQTGCAVAMWLYIEDSAACTGATLNAEVKPSKGTATDMATNNRVSERIEIPFLH